MYLDFNFKILQYVMLLKINRYPSKFHTVLITMFEFKSKYEYSKNMLLHASLQFYFIS